MTRPPSKIERAFLQLFRRWMPRSYEQAVRNVAASRGITPTEVQQHLDAAEGGRA